MTLTFDPTTTGSMTGQLSISSNSSKNSTLAIPLSGTATSPSYQVNLAWQAPSSSNDPIAGYHVYRAPSGTTSYTLLNSTVDTQTAFTDSNVQNGSIYDYMVKSVDASGIESSPSNLTTVTIP
jgi:fibronectin type 3 domain-containing protein